MRTLLLLLLGCVLHIESIAMQKPRIHTDLGDIEGFIDNVTFDGDEFHVVKYLGIPYAEAPIEELRFKKPVPQKPFKSTYMATELKHVCIQGDEGSLPSDMYTESEDCLYLNVYVPYKESGSEDKLAVIVYIHGGHGKYAFVNGAANFVSGDAMSVVGDVIVVTFNYRMSILGFFNIEDELIRGNNGLWDQHEAIKWTHRNIAAFGGDPNKITLFGEGQGAVSAIMQTMYAGNLGLFHKVIAENGTPFPALKEGLSPFVTTMYPVMKTAWNCGCPQENVSEIAECMKNASYGNFKRFVDTTYDIEAVAPSIDGELVMGPVENMLEFQEMLTPFSEIDMMLGFYYNNIDNDYDHMDSNMQTAFIYDIILTVYGYGMPSFVEKIIANRYTNMVETDPFTRKDNYIEKLINDVFDLVPTVRTFMAHQNISIDAETVLYKLTSTGTTQWEQGANVSDIAVDDRLYKFGFSKDMLAMHNMSEFEPSQADWVRSRRMIEFYAGFATNKEPVTFSNESGYQNDSDTETLPCLLLPSGELTDYRRDPSVEFWLDIVPRLLELTRPSYDDDMDHEGHMFNPPDAEDDDDREKDISKEGANAVIIVLGVITGLLCLCLVAMGVFVLVVKVRRERLKARGGRY